MRGRNASGRRKVGGEEDWKVDRKLVGSLGAIVFRGWWAEMRSIVDGRET